MLNEPRYARGLRSSRLGLCDHELKTKAPEKVVDRFAASAALKGMDRSELLRQVVVTHTHGALTAHSEIPPSTQGRGDDEHVEVSITLTARMKEQLGGLAMMTGHDSVAEYLEHLSAVHLYGEQEGDNVLSRLHSMDEAS